MITYNSLTINEVLSYSRVNYADNNAVGFVGEKPLSYNEMLVHVRNTSSMLITLGVEKGDRVALLGENSPSWAISYLAITCMGAVVVPILPDFSDSEVGKILDHSQAKVVFVSAKQYPKINHTLQPEAPDVILLNTIDVIVPNSGTVNTNMEYQLPDPKVNIDYARLLVPKPMEEDLAAIIYTSGTTGRPKGVMLTHKNIISNCLSTFQIQNIKQTDRLISVLPLSHTYECTIGFIMPLMRGASVYYLQKPPTAPVLLPALKSIRPTMMLTVPLIIEKVFHNKVLPQLTSTKLKANLYSIKFFRKLMHRVAAKKLHKTFGGKLHFFGIGGSKLSFEVERFLYEGKFPYSIGYGMTETSPLLTGSAPSLVKFRSAGFTLPGQEIMINNPNSATGEGEVWVRGSNVMEGYYKDEELTREVIIDEGWLRTGDLGYLHPNGYLELKGRLKNMIVGPSGENIYPEDIEEVINSHSMVLESLVYELKGNLIAKVHLNYDALESKYTDLKDAAKSFQFNVHERTKEIIDEVRNHVNSKVAAFSRLNAMLEQEEPFEKTPTHKIKRYIYTNLRQSK